MDNMKDALDTWGRLLEETGYRVLKASTLKEAENVLRDRWVHLAILDVRMVDEDDENDISGLLLVQQREFVAVPKIVLTAHKSFEYVRMALAADAQGRRPAVNLVVKDEGPQMLMRAIEQAFANRVRINWDLEIRWSRRERLSFPHLASLIQPGLPNDTLVQRADELQDLIRRLFYDYQQIRIGRLLWHDGWRFCLPVLARSSQGVTDSRILVCGDRESLGGERERMERLAPKAFQGTRLVSTAETMHFGATACVLPDTNIETVQTLRGLFHSGKGRALKATFDHLLGGVLAAWHQHGQVVEKTQDMMSLYRQWVGLEKNGLSRTEIEQRIEVLVQAVRPFISPVDVEYSDRLTTFHFPNQLPLTYPDPVTTVFTPLVQHETPVVCRISPGRLTADNILVDAEQKTWLTDFACAGQAPQWWDFVCLEALVRFDLTEAPDLLAWQEFEESLVTPASLHDRLQPQEVIADLRTSITLIEQIRQQANSEAGSDPLPYYAGLLAWAVGAMAQYDPNTLDIQADQARGAHLLLAAAMIAGRLSSEVTNSPLPGGRLRLDDEGRVWIGDRCAAVLTGLRLSLLRCLYEQGGKTASYQTILETVYGEEYDATEHEQKQRIRQEISRLRAEIESRPGPPRYILTARERGYRLQVSGEAEE
jgi:DNA-binding response OmpR family regulator